MKSIDHVVKNTNSDDDKLQITISLERDTDNLYKAIIQSSLKSRTYHSLKTDDDLIKSVQDYVESLD